MWLQLHSNREGYGRHLGPLCCHLWSEVPVKGQTLRLCLHHRSCLHGIWSSELASNLMQHTGKLLNCLNSPWTQNFWAS